MTDTVDHRARSPLPDPLTFYDLERYLFEHVSERFHAEGSLGAFDFFAIVIWKANRAKSTIAKRLLRKDPGGRQQLEPIVRDLTASLHAAVDARNRLRILMQEWGFMLPMASAILTVLWPEEFTVYDVRACKQLGAFRKLGDQTREDRIWDGFVQYRAAVQAAVTEPLSLRDKDRVLWARSAVRQLESDIGNGFRPRDQLLVTSVAPGSELVDDMW